MEAAKNACRYISMAKILKADIAGAVTHEFMMNSFFRGSTPNPLLQALSTPCGLQDRKILFVTVCEGHRRFPQPQLA